MLPRSAQGIRSHGDRGRVRPSGTFLLLIVLVSGQGTTRAEDSAVSNSRERSPALRPIAVERGRAEFDLAAGRPGSKTLLVVSPLATGSRLYPITVRASSIADPGLPSIIPGPIVSPPSRFAVDAGPRSPVRNPDRNVSPSRSFHLLVRDGDVASASNYRRVDARLLAIGATVQVYGDIDDAATIDPVTVREVVATFDERIEPLARRRFGLAEDVDGDGRFTVFLSSWLGRLAGGRARVDGFVRGADFDLNLPAPFGNGCDMLYLNASLAPGSHLKTILAHEYTHAITFGHRAFPASPDGRLGAEEEGWLDEGLAHLVEDAHGFSRSNLDYRVNAFLAAPERYRLVVEDYYAADLFRSHGHRGGTYLFLRWCVDRHGEAVLDRLVRSRSRGVRNLEAATGRTFAELYRGWSTDLYLDAIDQTKGRSGAHATSYGTPRAGRIRVDGPIVAWSAAATSSHYSVIECPARGGIRVEVEAPPDADLQVTAVPLPDDLGELDLRIRPVTTTDGSITIRARVSTGTDSGPIRLETIAWDPVVPLVPPESPRPILRGEDLLRAFESITVKGGGRLASDPIVLRGIGPFDGPIVVRAIGTDAAGHRITAWAEVEPEGRVAGGTPGVEAPR